jgi:hypothetical protein
MIIARTQTSIFGVDCRTWTTVWERDARESTRTSFLPGGNVFVEHDSAKGGALDFISASAGVLEHRDKTLRYERLDDFSVTPSLLWLYSNGNAVSVLDSDRFSATTTIKEPTSFVSSMDRVLVMTPTDVYVWDYDENSLRLLMNSRVLSATFVGDSVYTLDSTGVLKRSSLSSIESKEIFKYDRISPRGRLVISSDESTLLVSTGFTLDVIETGSNTQLLSLDTEDTLAGFVNSDTNIVTFHPGTITVLNTADLDIVTTVDTPETIVDVMTPRIA